MISLPTPGLSAPTRSNTHTPQIFCTSLTLMSPASPTHCLRLLALCLLVLCAPVLDAADCCCRPQPNATAPVPRSARPTCCTPKQTSQPPHQSATCCQTAPATHRHSTNSRSLPVTKTCECCLNAAAPFAGQRSAQSLGNSAADLPDISADAPTAASPTAHTISQLTRSTPPPGNRRQAVLCCWRN